MHSSDRQSHHQNLIALSLFSRAESLADLVALSDSDLSAGERLATQVRGLVHEAFFLGVKSSEFFISELEHASAVHKSTGWNSPKE